LLIGSFLLGRAVSESIVPPCVECLVDLDEVDRWNGTRLNSSAVRRVRLALWREQDAPVSSELAAERVRGSRASIEADPGGDHAACRRAAGGAGGRTDIAEPGAKSASAAAP